MMGPMSLRTCRILIRNRWRSWAFGAGFSRPIRPFFSLSRITDHPKILVIDGTTAITGGINLADEYINAISVYGY